MKNEIVKLKCIDISSEGQGICKRDGMTVFVKEMLPGEEGDIKIIAEKKNMAFGIISNLDSKSKHRVNSDCPIASKCGGCDYRHVDYKYQLELKKKVLEGTFRKMGLDVIVNDVLGMEEPFFYRNKVQVPVAKGKFGFYRKNSNDIVEFDKCYIQSEIANDICKDVKELILKYGIDSYFRHILIKHGIGTNEVMLGFIVNDFEVPHLREITETITNKYSEIKSLILNLNTRNDNVILGDEEKVLFGRDYIIDEFENLKFKISFKSFYQVNYHQMIKLYTVAKDLAMVNEDTVLLDLFSGIGTISLFMSKYCKEVSGVEIVEPAVLNARENAKLNDIKNAKFYLDDARADLSKYLKDKDVVIVDPPRKGLNEDLIGSLIRSNIERIVYISCNPATMARDLVSFREYYDISNIQPVDMFPHTLH
ncbi:MAG: 23S rRNA (uracil(1939)-C(5))-methyltransferase RlmD, partial [Erysipelotrichaceae bacterium]|nr:23S rRNA (uracil(1939)-C(5))-methyltransferase RlmD [Erysipelotrichaceae bacterium]